MKFINKIINKIIQSLLTISGWFASLIIILMILFLFKEGLGLFNSSVIEKGYVLCVNDLNSVKKMTQKQLKLVFDSEITNWKELNGMDAEIMLFRLDNVFDYYSEEELGENYEYLPEKLGEIIRNNINIIAFIPREYLPKKNVFVLDFGNIKFNDFIKGTEWIPTATPAPFFGVMPLILGTLVVSLVAILIALPFGIGVAIYLAEIASSRIHKFLKPLIELLAGIPSVVYGFFGLVVVVPFVQKVFNLPVGETALAGSLVLAIMALPTIITIAEDSIRNTPISMKEASLALGGTHWQTIYRVIIPYSSSGILAAIILGIGRAIGETMAVLMVTGNSAVIPRSIFEPIRTIPATIAAELGEAPIGGSHYQALFALGCILFLLTLLGSILVEIINKNKKI